MKSGGNFLLNASNSSLAFASVSAAIQSANSRFSAFARFKTPLSIFSWVSDASQILPILTVNASKLLMSSEALLIASNGFSLSA